MNDNLHFARGLVIVIVALCVGLGAVFGIGMLMSNIRGRSEEIVFEDNDAIGETAKTEKKTEKEKVTEEVTEKPVVGDGYYPSFDDSLWANSVQSMP